MKPQSKRESWWQWVRGDDKRVCVKAAKKHRWTKKKMSKAKRATDKRRIKEQMIDGYGVDDE